jgi:hypothetical protein
MILLLETTEVVVDIKPYVVRCDSDFPLMAFSATSAPTLSMILSQAICLLLAVALARKIMIVI